MMDEEVAKFVNGFFKIGHELLIPTTGGKISTRNRLNGGYRTNNVVLKSGRSVHLYVLKNSKAIPINMLNYNGDPKKIKGFYDRHRKRNDPPIEFKQGDSILIIRTSKNRKNANNKANKYLKTPNNRVPNANNRVKTPNNTVPNAGKNISSTLPAYNQ